MKNKIKIYYMLDYIWYIGEEYLFNAKEFDEETGMYYYGARYYDPHLSLWMSTDVMQESYPHITPNIFVANNLLNYIDYDGNDIVQINNESI